MRDLFWLTIADREFCSNVPRGEAQMQRLEPFFPKFHGKPRVDDRHVRSAIIFINRSGLRWRDTPPVYGPPKTLYNRWKRWSDKGVFARRLLEPAARSGHTGTLMSRSH